MKTLYPLICLPLLVACTSDSDDTPPPPPAMSADYCYQMTTSLGEIELAIDASHAPITGENFKRYVDEGFYDGTLFHRVIDQFMIQGGGFTPGMEQKPTHDPIKNEAKGGFSNERGTLAMARTSQPDTATSQFFINHVDNLFLDWENDPNRIGYAVFGKVTKGMEVVDQIAIVDTHSVGFHGNVPVEDVVIEQIVEISCR
ncbi:peptidylprolyl isomerase [Ferrimonas marina]|uniref:Peptidyl-prolyl cis-trans isomerase n=1 Tax=Ferrimonas marina TaxID=299255 RepID=A0A1M5XC51_9GAMM|nr:peptidylprolyl isomerase [Ferrimonas marina]SHH97104.1 peptidylprolyl isomerase [Ferrimonas marina]